MAMAMSLSSVLRERADSSTSDKENVAPAHSLFGDGTKRGTLITDPSNKENIPPTLVSPFDLGPAIYLDHDSHTCGSPQRPTSPTGLNLEALSLMDRPPQPLMVLSAQVMVQDTRASMVVMHKAIFADIYPTLTPTDTLLFYARGPLLAKTNKYALSNASRVLAALLDGPPLLATQTRCLRLRGDFPPAIRAMLSFVETGTYALEPNTLSAHPAFTLLDLHVHAYLIGCKYEVPSLCAYAIEQYTGLASMILSHDVPSNLNMASHLGAATTPELESADLVERFLDSVVLVWKKTCEGQDELRDAVLEVVKAHMRQLMGMKYFVTLMNELRGFGQDVLESLCEDGFEVVEASVGQGHGVCFV